MNGKRKKPVLAGTCLNEYILCSWQRVTTIVIYRFVLVHFSFEKRSRIAYCFLFSSFSFMSFPRGDVSLTWITELLCKLLEFDITSIGKWTQITWKIFILNLECKRILVNFQRNNKNTFGIESSKHQIGLMKVRIGLILPFSKEKCILPYFGLSNRINEAPAQLLAL